MRCSATTWRSLATWPTNLTFRRRRCISIPNRTASKRNSGNIMSRIPERRGFVKALGGVAALLRVQRAVAQQSAVSETAAATLPAYARAQNYRSLKQSSYDRSGGNEDFWRIAPGQTIQVFESSGPGIITHIWFTISAQSPRHLKELVLRIFWEGNSKPSVE